MATFEKLIANPAALSNIIRRIAIEAGDITLDYFEGGKDAGVEEKGDGSPVSLADKEAELHIQKALNDLTPTIPMIGEEAAEAARLPDLKGEDYFWLVDPLDGTREFIAGGDDFTVNIALIHKGEPIMGVVFAPATGDLYAGYGQTAIKYNQDTGKEKPIHVRPEPKAGVTVVASRRHGSDEKLERFLSEFKVNKVVKKGSSLKICAIAEGKADLYPRFGPTCEWDIGAGHAVLRAAGGYVTKEDGTPLTYGGHNPKFLNPEFIASSFSWFQDTQ